MNVEPYVGLALQFRCDAVNAAATTSEAMAVIDRSLDRLAAQVAAARAWAATFHDCPLRLVVLPEYALTSFPLHEDFAAWRDKAALEPDSPVHARLASIARENETFLAINLYERNALAPAYYFQANLLFSPSGALELRYLRMISINSPSPYDFWDAYLESVGLDGVFPVAHTSIGRIGMIASEEILFPEIGRVLCLRGAELLLHCTSEVSGPFLTPKDIAKRARAIENGVYLISANSASITGTAIPPQSTDGMSKVVGPDGSILAATGGGESFNASAVIDIAGLRSRRSRAAMTNLLPRLPGEAFAPFYANAATLKPNGLANDPDVGRAWLRERLRPIANHMASGKR